MNLHIIIIILSYFNLTIFWTPRVGVCRTEVLQWGTGPNLGGVGDKFARKLVVFSIAKTATRSCRDPETRDNVGVADILRKSRHADPPLGLIYTHRAPAGSRACPVAADCG